MCRCCGTNWEEQKRTCTVQGDSAKSIEHAHIKVHGASRSNYGSNVRGAVLARGVSGGALKGDVHHEQPARHDATVGGPLTWGDHLRERHGRQRRQVPRHRASLHQSARYVIVRGLPLEPAVLIHRGASDLGGQGAEADDVRILRLVKVLDAAAQPARAAQPDAVALGVDGARVIGGDGEARRAKAQARRRVGGEQRGPGGVGGGERVAAGEVAVGGRRLGGLISQRALSASTAKSSCRHATKASPPSLRSCPMAVCPPSATQVYASALEVIQPALLCQSTMLWLRTTHAARLSRLSTVAAVSPRCCLLSFSSARRSEAHSFSHAPHKLSCLGGVDTFDGVVVIESFSLSFSTIESLFSLSFSSSSLEKDACFSILDKGEFPAVSSACMRALRSAMLLSRRAAMLRDERRNAPQPV